MINSHTDANDNLRQSFSIGGKDQSRWKAAKIKHHSYLENAHNSSKQVSIMLSFTLKQAIGVDMPCKHKTIQNVRALQVG